jgi:hypothetical protein
MTMQANPESNTSSAASSSARSPDPTRSIRRNVYINMTEMQYDEDSFLDVKKHMPELASIREGGKFPVALSKRSADRTT